MKYKYSKALVINETKMTAVINLPNGMSTHALIITDYDVNIIDLEHIKFPNIISSTFNIAYEKLEYERLEYETIRMMRIINGASDETELEIIVEDDVGNIQTLIIRFIE